MSNRQLSTEPPADAIVPQRHAEAPGPGERIASHYPLCFGCGDDHPAGLHMRVFAGDDLTVSAEFDVTTHHQGAPGLAHGGVLAAAFDEALGALNWLLRVPAVTARLETDFRKPVAVGRVVHIDAAIIGVAGRRVYTRAVGRLDDAQGPIALTASALFVQVSMEHFRANGRSEDVDRVARERAVGGGGAGHTWEINP